MLRIGNRTVVHTATFLLPEEEEALLEFSTHGSSAKFRIKFSENVADKGNVQLNVEPDGEAGDQGFIEFVNWNRPTRVCTPKALSVMEFSDFDVWLLASAMYADSKYFVTLQFMKGNKE